MRRFVADASHELRTPLAAIRGYAELARRRSDDTEAVAHALRRVESESHRMTSLVDDLLLLARLDSGSAAGRRGGRPDPAGDGRGVRRQGGRPGPPLAAGSAGGAGHRARRPARLHQVLANLLANARTHTPAGTTVVTGLRDRRPTPSVVTVTDNGDGHPGALQPEIFGRFVRGDSSRSRAAGSTGLGPGHRGGRDRGP